MSHEKRVYQAALWHIEEHGLDLERDGLTTILADPVRGWVGTKLAPFQKRRAVVQLVIQHVALLGRLKDAAEARADLELLDG